MSQFTKPDFLKAGPMLSNVEQRIDTDILEPVVQSETFIRFQLQNKGLLNPQSRITFSLLSPGTESYWPIGVGVGALVERATLKIGGKTICEVQDWGHYQAYKSLFIDQSVNKEREQFMSGRALSMGVVYNDNTNVSSYVSLDNGKERRVDVDDAASTDLLMFNFQKLNAQPVFSVSLDDLIPCLRSQRLPLFLLSEEVQIELTLTPQAKRVCIASGGDLTKSFLLDQSETRLIADYTFLDGDEMDQYRAQNKGYSYTFLEPRLTKTTLATAADWENQVRNVGGAGRVVARAIVSITSETISASGPIKTALGSFRSIAPESSGKGVYGKLTSNFRKNDRFLYPIDRSNSALHYHGLMDAEGGVPHVTRSLYARQGYSVQNSKFEGHVLNTQEELQGQFFYTAYRFNDGARVDSRGLELHSQLSAMGAANAPYVSRVWIEQEKIMTIVDGKVDTYYS
tara:strand:- start:1720 stop:3087 length:1368 start_codon:yes stop_codon:yes gene_type:complete